MKKICDNCGKETSELYLYKEIQICSECLHEYEAHLRTMYVKAQRNLYEMNDDVEDMK